MTKKAQTSEEIAAVAGRILAMAKQGGPMKALATELARATDPVLCNPISTEARLAQIEKVLKSYIDDAERCAASALAQS